MENRRLTVITGHYGSGKTNLAVNIAVDTAKLGKKCVVIDLDIVNPYFRTADFGGLFDKLDIGLYAPVYANTNLDIPSLNIPLASILESGVNVVIDVGGDDEGAKALGRFVPIISAFGDTDILYVVNKYRYLTREAQDAVTVMREIEESAGLSCTGIVNNSNLGAETTERTVVNSLAFIDELAMLSGIPLKANCIRNGAPTDNIPLPYPVEIYVKAPWDI